MKVEYDGPTAQYHPGTGLTLTPGVFPVAEEQGRRLVEVGLVREVPEDAQLIEGPPPVDTVNDAAPAAARARKGRE